MTAPHNQIVDTAEQGREAITSAIRTWADAAQNFAGQATSGRSELPDLSEAVTMYFDFAEKMLANQRQLVQQWATVAEKASAAVAEQGQRTTESMAARSAKAAENVVDQTTAAARGAGENVVPTGGMQTFDATR